jgi:hypothetical protein
MEKFSSPPFGAKFRYMNETWVTVGWATKPDAGNYVWCRHGEATFVIGQRMSGSGKSIAPIAKIGQASKRRQWEYVDALDIRIQEHGKADQNVRRRLSVVEGRLVFG